MHIEVRAQDEDEDIRRYLLKRLQSEPRWSRHLKENPDLIEEIIANILKKACGMCLLANLQLEEFLKAPSIKQIRKILAKSSAYTVHHIYSDAIARILAQPSSTSELGVPVLSWLLCAQSRLTLRALQEALSIGLGDTFFDAENVVDAEILVSACGGLVTIDAAENIIRLAHYTLFEFLE
ncbi:MAG: hypothetical protein Q9187_009719, partial [Circinaria calcarea]